MNVSNRTHGPHKLALLATIAFMALTAQPSQAQVTSTSQLTDIRPNHWAPVALGQLVGRYGCVAGYDTATYRISRPVTRYEFASKLNGCLDRIRAGAQSGGPENSGDRAVVTRLENEFQPELLVINGRVNSLEARVEGLEAHQNSKKRKTKKLSPDASSPGLTPLTGN
jgi:hypothetical protein